MDGETGDVVIEIDRDARMVPAVRVWPYTRMVIGVVVGFVLGFVVAGFVHRAAPVVTPPVATHTVVITEDGRSETFLVPAGSVVSTPPVRNSCSITVDGLFVDVINRVVGNAECAATVR
jgi:hypothetical protein